jgi:hypothetical protein
MGGTCPPPPIFTPDRPEIHASFGAKHKNFGKIMSGKIFVCVRKLREKREIVLVCPENFLYVCETDYGILGKLFWYVREKHFKTSPPLANNFRRNIN